MLLHWTLTFFGNLAGSLFVVAVIAGYGGIFSAEAYTTEIHTFVTTKQLKPEWHQIFLRGIGANWLVCLACFLGMSGRELVSKIVGIWWPTFAFVSLGFDHGTTLPFTFFACINNANLWETVVANMFFIPIGIWVGTPGVTVGLYIWKGIIPALLGNIVGGGVFVGAYFWYQYLQGQDTNVIDGQNYEAEPVGMLDMRTGHVDFGRKKRVSDVETLREANGAESPKAN